MTSDALAETVDDAPRAPGRAAPLARFLDPLDGADPVPRRLETGLFALAAPLLGTLLRPDDPLGLDAGFAWALAGPLALAARDGTERGFSCALLAGLACAAHLSSYADEPFRLVELVAGLLVGALVVGEIGLAWRRRTERARTRVEALAERLHAFSDEHRVLKASHTRLERTLGDSKLALRTALERVERAASDGRGAFGRGFAGNADLMALFAHFGMVQVAGLHAMASPDTIDPTPVAALGATGVLAADDPLLLETIRTRTTTALRLDAPGSPGDEHALVAAVPVVDASGHLHGVVAVREMHPMAFRRENLNLLTLLGAWLGDRFGARGGFAAGPGEHFLAELDAALHRVREHGVPATLVGLVMRGVDGADAAAALVAGDARRLDRTWIARTGDGRAVVAVLLPLTDASDARRYLERTRSTLVERLGPDAPALVDAARVRPVGVGDTRRRCLESLGIDPSIVAANGAVHDAVHDVASDAASDAAPMSDAGKSGRAA